jgi:hypothetical protein
MDKGITRFTVLIEKIRREGNKGMEELKKRMKVTGGE